MAPLDCVRPLLLKKTALRHLEASAGMLRGEQGRQSPARHYPLFRRNLIL